MTPEKATEIIIAELAACAIDVKPFAAHIKWMFDDVVKAEREACAAEMDRKAAGYRAKSRLMQGEQADDFIDYALSYEDAARTIRNRNK